MTSLYTPHEQAGETDPTMTWPSALYQICRPPAYAQGLDLIGAGPSDQREVRQPLRSRAEGRKEPMDDYDWSRPPQAPTRSAGR